MCTVRLSPLWGDRRMNHPSPARDLTCPSGEVGENGPVFLVVEDYQPTALRAVAHDEALQSQCRLLIGICAELRLLVTAPELRPAETTSHLRVIGCEALASGEIVMRHSQA